ncbi:MAG: hypothetical protein J7L46_05700 [Bacteroidales bacterium]|nr:hypothetical protein [Bacteroidales bacterium]
MRQDEAKGYMETIYGRSKVMTLCELADRMMVSEITVRRKLKKSGALTSFNRNGKYYTLPHIPVFDSYGLWNYKEIRFSRHGNMHQTIIQLVNQSLCGLHAGAIGELIGYPPHSLLNKLCAKSLIKREKLHGRYVYFSIKDQLYKSQRDRYETVQQQYSEDDMPCTTAVKLLLEKIKRPESNPSELARALRKENISISELQVKRFFEKHGLEKKTPTSR